MFFQLRIADEFKDREEDARWRPYRPVPRGLVKLSELRVVFIIAALLQIALVLAHDVRLLLVLAVAWTYFTLMSVEFFCRDWLKARPGRLSAHPHGHHAIGRFLRHRLRVAAARCIRACRARLVSHSEFLQRHRHRNRPQTPPARPMRRRAWKPTAACGGNPAARRCGWRRCPPPSAAPRWPRRASVLSCPCSPRSDRARHRLDHPSRLSPRPTSRQAHRVTHRTVDTHALSHVRHRAALAAVARCLTITVLKTSSFKPSTTRARKRIAEIMGNPRKLLAT